MAASCIDPADLVIHQHGYEIAQVVPHRDRRHGRRSTQDIRQWLRSGVLLLGYLLRARFVVQLWTSPWYPNHKVAGSYCLVQLMLFAAQLVRTVWQLICNSTSECPRLRLVGPRVPLVDIIITTCGEDVQVILDTVRACCAADYPLHRRRILVSDDAADDDLREAVQELGNQTHVGLTYFSRNAKGSRKPGAKAGNMNAAIGHLDQVYSESHPYAVFIDADMIVEPDFLRAEMAHMVMDSSVGLCIIPQNFYNIPMGDPLHQSLNAQQQWDEVLRDSARAAWNSGAGALIRRKALAEIGGFPEDSLTEDVLTGMLMQGRGWRVAYCNEALQFGLVPETFRGHIRQRVRWSVGAFRNAKRLSFGMSTSLLPLMTAKQRYLAFTEGVRCWFSTPTEVLCWWILLALVASGQPLIVAADMSAIVKTYAAVTTMRLIHEILDSSNAGYITMRKRDVGHNWLLPHLAAAFMQEVLPSWLGGLTIHFVPTGVSDSAVLERQPDKRPPMVRRLTVMVLHQGLWYHILVCFVTISVAAGTVYHHFDSLTGLESWSFIFRRLLVPGLEWDIYIAALLPIIYAIWPPDMPPRRELLRQAEISHGGDGISKHSVWYPRPVNKEQSWNTMALLSILPRILFLAFWILAGAVLIS